MTSKDRRTQARERLANEMALRAETARRRRRTQTVIASAAAGAVLVGAIVWIAIATSGDDGKPGANPSASPDASQSSPTGCDYKPLIDPSASGASPGATQSLPPGAKEVGKPPADPPRAGKQVITFNTNQGVIKVEMDLSKVPCTAASFTHLAGQKFYDNTKCHRLVPEIGALQCGDPTGDGTGGPTYRFADENLPTNRRPAYPAGVLAMANAGPDTNGSQFFFVFKDSPLQAQYTIVGRITEGMDVIKKIAEGGHDGKYDPNPGGGVPKTEVILQSVTVTPVAA